MQSQYKNKFFQGATLIPRTLVFFKIIDKSDNSLIISSDRDIISRAKKKWVYHFLDREIERELKRLLSSKALNKVKNNINIMLKETYPIGNCP